MEAIQFDVVKKTLKVAKKEIPKVTEPNQVLIKVAYAGICGTDLHVIQGEFPCRTDGFLTLGHEFSGTVIEVGKEVCSCSVGDKVAVDPNCGCQNCNCCHSGNPHFCETGGINSTVGIFKDGGWGQYCLVPQKQVHKLPESITLEQGALCEPLSCLAHGWDRILPITVGQKILITGAGIIGNLWTVALHLQGHRRVTVSEPNIARLEYLKKSFIKYNYVTPDMLKPKVDGFDLVIDCSGNARAIEQGFSLLNPGGKLCIFGVAPPHAKINISPYEIYLHEVTIIGVNINPFTFPKAIGLAEALGSQYLNYNLLGIKTFNLHEYEEALDMLKKGSIAKAVFKF